MATPYNAPTRPAALPESSNPFWNSFMQRIGGRAGAPTIPTLLPPTARLQGNNPTTSGYAIPRPSINYQPQQAVLMTRAVPSPIIPNTTQPSPLPVRPATYPRYPR